jgi:hypothetical protein
MLPYWDWSDPSPIMIETFLGPNGTVGSEVRLGYFAADAPGTGTNTTPTPAWWPAGSPVATAHGLRNVIGTVETALVAFRVALGDRPERGLGETTYAAFQNAIEAGRGLSSGNQIHNGMHGWIGGPGQMSFPQRLPFDPSSICITAISIVWAMWQVDGHATEYPATGGKP